MRKRLCWIDVYMLCYKVFEYLQEPKFTSISSILSKTFLREGRSERESEDA